ncbi:MAG: RNA polymerase sigma factor [Phycisphaeraceae bacterium]|nr:MAG: RNA polymerase sigma factor [Phycisphaeraceae bacterium]
MSRPPQTGAILPPGTVASLRGDATGQSPAVQPTPPRISNQSSPHKASRPQPPAGESTDETLASAAAGGDKGALTTLLTRHEGRIYAICLRMVNKPEPARDLTQDAMVRLIEGLGSFDGRASFTTWMTRVVVNVCLSDLRKQKLRRHRSLEASDPSTQSRNTSLREVVEDQGEPGAAERVQMGDERRRLETALSELEPEQRAILILRDVRGLDYSQIAETFGVAVGTVKSRLFRARAGLRERMERLEGR